jgi:hypothetical protein
MWFWFGILVVISLLLTPTLWHLKGKNCSSILGWQVAKIIMSLIGAYFIGYLSLKDQSLSAVFANIVIPYLIILFLDSNVISGLEKKPNSTILNITSGLGIVVMIVWLIMSIIYPLTIKGKLYDVVQVEEKQEKIQATDINHIPTVPIESARYKAEKLIGQLTNSSYYELGDLTRQKVNGEEVWVAPIEYRGFFESKKADSVPGYIKVSAERKDDIGVLLDDYQMKYVPSAYFGKNLDRIVRRDFPSKVIIGGGFEPDDSGKPFYVIALGHYEKYRSATKIDGIVIVDPETGLMKYYDLKDIPEYVDFVVPPNLASSYNEWVAKYKHGWWNTVVGKTDISTVHEWNTGEEVIGVFGPDQRMYWFTDHSSPGTNSLKGYTLMDGRTGKFIFYKGSNGFSNGKAALNAVHDSFKKELWTGTNPVLYNIYGHDTWYIPVIDASGLLRAIALVNAHNPQIVATGESKQESLNMYKFKLATEGKGEGANPTDDSELKEVTGKVLRVGSIQIGETSVVQILLDNSENVFNVNPKEATYATFIREGDIVKLNFVDTKETIVTVEKIFNQTLKR